MPVEISWYQENRILHSRYQGDITLEDIQYGIAEALRIVLEQPYPVPHIVDLSALTSVHSNIKDFSDIRSTLKNLDRSNWVIIVGITGVSKFIATVVTHMAGLNCKIADSLAEAQTFSEHIAFQSDASLVDG